MITPLLLLVLLAGTSLTIINRQVVRENNLSVSYAHQALDRVFAQANAASQDLLFGSQFQRLARAMSPKDLDSLYLYETSIALKRLVHTGSAIIDLMVFSPSMNYYISSTRWGSLDKFSAMDNFPLMWNSLQYDKVFTDNTKKMRIENATCCLAAGDTYERILLIRPISYSPSGWEHEFFVAFLIDMESLFSGLSDFRDNLLLVNRVSSEVVYDFSGNYQKDSDAKLFAGIHPGDSETFGSIIATASHSKETNIAYIVIKKRILYFRTLMLFSGFFVIYFLVALTGGWTVAQYKTRKEWEAYEDAILRSGSALEVDDQVESPYGPFVSSLAQLREEKEGMSQILVNQTQSLKSYMIARLLNGGHAHVSKEALEMSGITFVSDYFFVILIAHAQIKMDEQRERHLIKWFEDAGYSVLPFSSDHGIALILNPSISGSNEDVGASVYQSIQQITHDEEFYTYDFVASSLVTGLKSLGKAYLQAVDVLAYKRFIQSEEFMNYEDMVEMSSQANYIYSTEQALVLSQAIQQGDANMAYDLIGTIVAENRALGISPQRLRYLLFAIASTVVEITSKLAERYPGMLPSIHLPPILQADNFEESRKAVEEIVGDVSAVVKQLNEQFIHQGGEHYNLYQQALKIIADTYTSVMLNVSSIADDLSISTTFLSRIFKRYHGSNISDYICSVRVEASKILLAKGQLVGDVAEQCGFGSLRTFMRVFKDLEKITPGQYRELQTLGE